VKRRDAKGFRAGYDSLKQSCGDCHDKGGVGAQLEHEHEQGIEGNTPRTKELVDRGLDEIFSSSCELVELSFEINGVNHTLRAVQQSKST
jgi:hypothetical protein